ncbi:uncharacterized protein LOC134237583 [Saccostrea cucullata]|uniref:uncharacterized protein LOC134237583 n=1 Tax=Saccostrea cuccullata TaxID=36930 RepID=UPI002ED2A20F
MDPRTSAQDVMRCDLCETAVVQMHCDTCLVNLCKACVGEHVSVNLSKPHKIVDFKDKQSIPIYPECTTHDKERCKMYCKQCDTPLCNKCIASDQHLGHRLSEILQILEEKRDTIIQNQIELKETIYPTYQDIASKVQIRISQLEKKYRDLSTAITKHAENWHREIDEHVKKLKAEVDVMKNTQRNTLQKHLDEVNKNISDIKDEINSLEDAVASKDIFYFYNVKFDLEKYKRLPIKIVPSLPNFTPGRIQGGELSKLFGSLAPSSMTTDEQGYRLGIKQKLPEAEFCLPEKQLLDEPETVTTIVTGYERLYNVACLSDEEIWTSGNGNIMKLFSINQGSLLKSIRTKSGNWPCDIAVTKIGDLAYTDHKDRTVNIVKNEKIEKVIRLKKWKPLGNCVTSSGNLLVILMSNDGKQTKVVQYYGSIEIESIQFKGTDKPLYSESEEKHITENKNLDICVSDNEAGAVVVVNRAGKPRFRYTGHTPAPKNQPFSPRGITTDSQSHILTADISNDCIHIIDQDGHFLRYIECGLSYPIGLCSDTNDNLFVAEWENRKVKKIKYLQ